MDTSSTEIANNTNTATESVCPRNWTLPTKKQIDSNTNVTEFSPVLGGGYGNGDLMNEATHGFWWGSESGTTGTMRHVLGYIADSNLYVDGYNRRGAVYIRCVSEEKAITSLTYMQDMTPVAV